MEHSIISELLYSAFTNDKNASVSIARYELKLLRMDHDTDYEIKFIDDATPLNPVFSLRYIEKECITQDFFDAVIRLIYDNVPRVREYFDAIMFKDGDQK